MNTEEIMKLADSYAGYQYGSASSKEARAALEAALSAKQGEQDAVAWRTEVEYGKLLFHIGVQSFAIDYTPEDEPDFSAGDAMAWMEQRLREALSKLAHPSPSVNAQLLEKAKRAHDKAKWINDEQCIVEYAEMMELRAAIAQAEKEMK